MAHDSIGGARWRDTWTVEIEVSGSACGRLVAWIKCRIFVAVDCGGYRLVDSPFTLG